MLHPDFIFFLVLDTAAGAYTRGWQVVSIGRIMRHTTQSDRRCTTTDNQE